MDRVVRLAILVLASLAPALFVSAPAFAQGGSGGQTTTSAGDNQYIDPLANQGVHHKHKAKPKPKRSSSHGSATAPSSGSSSSPSPPTTQSSQTSGGASGSTAVAAGGAVAKAHKKKVSPARPAKTSQAVTTTASTAATSSDPTPPAALSSPSHSGSSFPYVYLIVAVCVALGAALLSRHLLLRRTARRS